MFSDEDGSVSPPSETSEDTTSSEEVHSPSSEEAHSPKIKDESDVNQSTTDENQPENVLVIDTTFTCKINAPGMDPFEIKVFAYVLFIFT